MNILIVDDESEARHLLRAGAERASHKVIEAENGQEGLRLAAKDKPDLIISDVLMPVMDGFFFLREIKKDPALKDLPFVFYSATYTDQEDIGLALCLGADDYIVKPQEPEEFWTKVNRALERHKSGNTVVTGPAAEGSENECLRRHTQAVALKLEKMLKKISETLETQKQVGEALSGSEERLKTLINGTPDIICFKDGRGRWLEANDSDLELFNLKTVDYRYKTDSELAAFSPLHRAAFLACEASDEIAWQKGAVSRSEESVPRYDGTVSVYDIIKSPIFHQDGSRKGLVVLGRDITERKQAEDKVKAFNAILEQKIKDRTAELLASNEELEAFSYSVSHDLKGPLRRMEGFTTMLAEVLGSSLSGDARGYMERIKSSAAGMETLIERMLILSRTGRGRMSFAPVPLAELAAEALDELSGETAGRKIEWVVGKLPSVTGDRAMLKQVFLNLLGNSVKYTRPVTNTRIEISAKHKGKETIISVRDNGVGFDMEQAGRLFGISQRLHSAVEFEGSGIGLYTVRRIVTGHGGKVWAEGKTGAGATFNFSISDTPDAPK